MSKAPSMPMYWDAYLADTTHLTTEEHGAYMLLLAAMWRRDGSVPDDDKDNARILGLTVAKWKRTKARLSMFLIFDGDTITQKNLQKIWKATQEKIAVNKVNGAKGGRAAASNNKDLGQANATNSQERKATIPEPEPEPIKIDTIVSTKKQPIKKATAIPENWVPSDRNIQDAIDRQFSEKEISNEADQFRDYNLAKGNRYKDWDAAWRTWLGNSRKFSAGRGMAGKTNGAGHGRGRSIASIVARRRVDGIT